MNTPTPPPIGTTTAPPATSTPTKSSIETRGLDPVPLEERTVGGWHLFQILVNTLLNPGLMLIGGLAVISGLTPFQAVGAVLAGIVVAFAVYIVLATLGVDFGLPGIVATRATLGIVASRWIVSTLRALSSAFWFAVQTTAGAYGIVSAIKGLTGLSLNFIAVCLVFGILQLLVAVKGYSSLTWLSRLAFPAKMIGLPWIVIALLMVGDQSLSEVLGYNAGGAGQLITFAIFANTVAVTWLSQVTDAADYCRYTASRRSMWIATSAAALIGAGASAAFGAFGAAWSKGTSGNTFEVAGAAGVGTITLVVILIVLVLENWTVNVMNLYTGGLALNNLLPNVGRLWSTLIVGMVGIGLALLPQLANRFTDVIANAGLIFAPLAGVLVADYLFIRRGNIDLSQVFRVGGAYWYQGGFNISALFWTAVGGVAYVVIPDWWIPAVLTILVSGLGYLATARILHGPSLMPATSSHFSE
ncbi:purine-cytosine permease family protein [Leucobacter sp. 1207-22]|uniref:purine-cytosine permease family protein n=1 Tax=Leucobacter sp. 1207-22 TaxID=2604456 RepID=UPI004063A9BA